MFCKCIGTMMFFLYNYELHALCIGSYSDISYITEKVILHWFNIQTNLLSPLCNLIVTILLYECSPHYKRLYARSFLTLQNVHLSNLVHLS